MAFGILLLPQVKYFFFSRGGLRWAYVLLISCTLSFSLVPMLCWIAKKFDIVDRPNQRKVHVIETPLLGGAAVFIGFIAALVLNGIFSTKLLAILSASTVLFIVGLMDDIKELPASVKLLVQLACTIGVMAFGIVLHVLPESLGLASRAGNVFLTILWIIGITNSMNFFDGMNGLAAGLGAIIAFFLGVTAFQTYQPFLGWIAAAMMGACIGFLPFNFRKNGTAMIFLGDAGSTTIGFVLACVAVYGGWSNNPIVALASPILIFWVLIFDMVHITIDRIVTGRVHNFQEWVDYVGKDHLHHRLAYVLGSTQKSVIFIFLLKFCLGAGAIALRNARIIDAILLLSQAAIMVVLITILERRGRRLGLECKDLDFL